MVHDAAVALYHDGAGDQAAYPGAVGRKRDAAGLMAVAEQADSPGEYDAGQIGDQDRFAPAGSASMSACEATGQAPDGARSVKYQSRCR